MSFWEVHGRDPAPLQRPILAGAITGFLAALPAAALVWFTGSAMLPARIIGLPSLLLVLLSIAGLTVAGVIYGAIFMRAANDREGCWLFGLGWGFITWAVGPITLCQWVLRQPVSAGTGASVLLAGHIIWGLILGSLFPLIQSWVALGIDEVPPPRRESLKRKHKGRQEAPQSYRKVSGG